MAPDRDALRPHPSSDTDVEVRDHVDAIIDQWRLERPDVNVSGMELIGRLTRVTAEIQRRLNAVFAEHDLESWEFDVLATLLRSGPPYQLTPGRLLESAMITSGAMTNRLQRLEARGFIERAKSATDGRQVVVSLTDDGRALVGEALVDHAANERLLLSGLSTDQEAQFIELLRALNRSLNTERSTSE